MKNNYDVPDKINYVCSLGNYCHSANILKRIGIKICSYPFDWIFSNSGMITHCLQDDFKTFLSNSHYRSVSKTVCEHDFYKQHHGLNLMFRHFNPLVNKKDYSYYKRCVKRFRHMLKMPNSKLFVKMFINMSNGTNEINEKKLEIMEFEKKMSAITNNYIFLVIFNISNQNKNYHNFILDLNIHYLELHTVSSSAGVGFTNEDDNVYLDNIIMQAYSFDLIESILN